MSFASKKPALVVVSGDRQVREELIRLFALNNPIEEKALGYTEGLGLKSDAEVNEILDTAVMAIPPEKIISYWSAKLENIRKSHRYVHQFEMQFLEEIQILLNILESPQYNQQRYPADKIAVIKKAFAEWQLQMNKQETMREIIRIFGAKHPDIEMRSGYTDALSYKTSDELKHTISKFLFVMSPQEIIMAWKGKKSQIELLLKILQECNYDAAKLQTVWEGLTTADAAGPPSPMFYRPAPRFFLHEKKQMFSALGDAKRSVTYDPIQGAVERVLIPFLPSSEASLFHSTVEAIALGLKKETAGASHWKDKLVIIEAKRQELLSQHSETSLRFAKELGRFLQEMIANRFPEFFPSPLHVKPYHLSDYVVAIKTGAFTTGLEAIQYDLTLCQRAVPLFKALVKNMQDQKYVTQLKQHEQKRQIFTLVTELATPLQKRLDNKEKLEDDIATRWEKYLSKIHSLYHIVIAAVKPVAKLDDLKEIDSFYFIILDTVIKVLNTEFNFTPESAPTDFDAFSKMIDDHMEGLRKKSAGNVYCI